MPIGIVKALPLIAKTNVLALRASTFILSQCRQFILIRCNYYIDACMHKQHNGFAMSGKEPLERHAKYVRVLSFDFSIAFDSVPHDILCDKATPMH